MELTPVEQFQAFRPERITSSKESIIALSQKIKADSDTQHILIQNPYTTRAKEVLKDKFEVEQNTDSIKAIVLSEPERTYESSLPNLSKAERAEKLYKQIDVSADITMRLSDYVETHKDEFWNMASEQIYSRLSSVAFQTDDLDIINTKFAQSQRRGFRLAIINFIDGIQKLKVYQDKFAKDPAAMTKQLLGVDINDKVIVESLPIGIVIYLKGKDFQKAYDFYTRDKSLRQIVSPDISASFTLLSLNLPTDIRGKIVVVNIEPEANPEESKKHELKHVAFNSFSATDTPERWVKMDISKSLNEMKTVEEYQLFADGFQKMMLERLRDEVIAYASHYIGQLDIRATKGEIWQSVLYRVQDNLTKRGDITTDEKIKIFSTFQSKYFEYLRELGEYQWIVLNLMRIGLQKKNGMSYEKVLAMLTNTPIEKSRRLARYFGINNPNMVPNKYAEDNQQMMREFSEKVAQMTGTLDSDEGRTMSEITQRSSWEKTVGLNLIARMPVNLSEDALPTLLQVIRRSNHETFVDYSLDALSLILELYGGKITQVSKEQTKSALDSMIHTRNAEPFKNLQIKALFLIVQLDNLWKGGNIDFKTVEKENPGVLKRLKGLFSKQR